MDELRFVAERGRERFEIIEGRGEGLYVLRYLDGLNTHDYLASDLSGAYLTAEGEWGVLTSAWRSALPDELPLWRQPPTVEIVEGDLLNQDVDVIVNAWNRNIFPWWLLLPQGVSGAIKRRGGTAPFKELRKHGWIPLGGAVLTSAGTLPFKGIIHVAGINLLWRASERSIRDSVKNAVQLAHKTGFKSMALSLDRGRVWWFQPGPGQGSHAGRTEQGRGADEGKSGGFQGAKK